MSSLGIGASVAQPGRCFSTPESIRLVSGKARSFVPRRVAGSNPARGSKNHSVTDFVPVRILPEKPLLRRGTVVAIWVFFFSTLFLSERDYGLVSVRWARYQLLRLFSILVDSPSDQRGRSCSRNHGLRFMIRFDNGRFLLSRFRSNRSCHAKPLTHTPLFSGGRFAVWH